MPPFAVFFADEAVVGITRVEASDAAAAEELVLDQHPGGRVHAVDGGAAFRTELLQELQEDRAAPD